MADRTVGSGNVLKSQEVPNVTVVNRYDVLNSHQDLSILHLKSIVSENDRRTHQLENQLTNKEKFIENVKNESFSLKSEKRSRTAFNTQK